MRNKTMLAGMLIALVACDEQREIHAPPRGGGCTENADCGEHAVCAGDRCRTLTACNEGETCAHANEVCARRGEGWWCAPAAPEPERIVAEVYYVEPVSPSPSGSSRPRRPYREPLEYFFTCAAYGDPARQVRIPAHDLRQSPTGRIDEPWPTNCGSGTLDTTWTVYAVNLRCRRTIDAQLIAPRPNGRRVVSLILDCTPTAQEAKP